MSNPASNSLHLWAESGSHLLVVQPFMDSLIERGEGCYLIDSDGRRILDLAAGQFCSILGHRHERFNARLAEQLQAIVHLGDQYVSPGVLKAAERLAGVVPKPLEKVIFLSTGSEANECAMRIAKTVTGRSGMLAYTRGYYGISLATRNLSSISDHDEDRFDFQPSIPGQFKLLTPTCRHCPIQQQQPECNSACLDVSLEMLGHHAASVAAVIVEPIVSAGGMILPPASYLQELAARTRAMGALFIVDEAQTGFGRCGQWFDIQNLGIVPDIMVLSKSAGSGYPASAVVVSGAVARELEAQNFSHLSSHQNDPLAAAAVHAVIDIVETEGLVANSRDVGNYFVDALRKLQARYPVISDVRGRGLMIGVELAEDADPFRLVLACERRGLHLTFSYYEPVLRIIPPLILSRAEVDVAIGTLDEALAEVARGGSEWQNDLPQNPRSGPIIKRTTVDRLTPARVARKLWSSSPQEWVAAFSRRYGRR
jgi:2,2-dialkylglycine decarboxylase (pyruvate)